MGQRIGGDRKPKDRDVQGSSRASDNASKNTGEDGGTQGSKTSSDMTREQALKALGLEPDATATEIDAAFKQHARQNGSLNGSEQLSQARDVLRGRESS